MRVPALAGAGGAVLAAVGVARRDEREPAGRPRSAPPRRRARGDRRAASRRVDGGELPGVPSTVVDVTGAEPSHPPRGRASGGGSARPDRAYAASYGSLTSCATRLTCAGETRAAWTPSGSPPQPPPRRSLLAAAPAALAKAPAASTGAATSVGARSAVVSGRVDPGGESTSWYVEYGATTAYGSRTDGAERGQRHDGRRRHRAAPRPRDGRHVPLPPRRLERRPARPAARTRASRRKGSPRSRRRRALRSGPSAATSAGPSTPTGGRPAGGSSTAPRRATARARTRAPRERERAPSASRCALEGLRAGVEYHFRLVAANDLGTVRGADRSFRTDPAPVRLDRRRRRRRGLRRALNGIVDPRGRGTAAWFEYGTTPALGSRTPEQAPLRDAHARSTAARRDCSRARATTTASSPGATPARPPGRRARSRRAQARSRRRAAAGLRATSVVLTGSVDPVGRATEWWFELGPTTAYGTSTVVHGAGSGRGAVAVSETIAGLAPGTEYHARLVARSSAGTTRGADVVFRTAGAPVVGAASASRISLTRGPIGVDVQTSGLETRVWVELAAAGRSAAARASSCSRRRPSADAASRSASVAPARRAIHLPRRRDERRRDDARARARRSAPPRGRGTSAGRPLRCTIAARTVPTASWGRAAAT